MGKQQPSKINIQGRWSEFPVSYEEIYGEASVWSRTSMLGRTTLACQLGREDIRGGTLCDIGCGGGRLPIMASSIAKGVVGIDPAPGAIRVAQLISETFELSNAQFLDCDVENYKTPMEFDVLTAMGVIEHVKEPVTFLHHLSKLLKRGGLLILEVPSFLNFRGDVYMTLLKLFDYPMSLADIRQVTEEDVAIWSRSANLSVELTVGHQYGMGWLEKGIEDLLTRVPAAIADSNSNISTHWSEFEQWTRSRIRGNHHFIDYLLSSDILQRIENLNPLVLPKNPMIPDELHASLEGYVQDDPSGDPFYCTQEPFNKMGAGTMYFLRKSW